MFGTRTEHLWLALTAVILASGCESRKESTADKVAAALSARVPPPAPKPTPPPPPAPEPSAEPDIEAPAWVTEYADHLCKRVAVCREKMLGAVPPQQKMMLAMQIPTQEACVKNTTTFKKTAPKAELDKKEKKEFDKCLVNVKKMACGNVQTGKYDPECQVIADLISEAQKDDGKGGAGGQ